MKKMLQKSFLFGGLLLLLSVPSCKLPENPGLPAWEVELLAPIVQSRFALTDILSLAELDLDVSYDLNDFGFGPVPAVIPPQSEETYGPYEIIITDNYIAVTLSSGVSRIRIENNLPIQVNQGARIVLRNDADEVLSSKVVERNLAPGDTWVGEMQLGQVRYTSTLRLSIENFSSPGSGTDVVSTSDSGLRLDYEVRDITVESIEFAAPDDVEFTTVEEVDLSLDAIESFNPYGYLVTSFDNGVNAALDVQVYFLESREPRQVIDSLFVTPLNVPANPNSGSFVNTRDSVYMSLERYERISQARFMELDGVVRVPNTGTGSIIYLLQEQVGLRLIADFRGTVNAPDTN